MTDVKKYVWVIPFIAGILAIISLLTPVASMNYMGTANLWLWGLYDYNIMGVMVGSDFMVLIPSLITTTIIALSVILLIGSSIGLKKNLRNIRNFSLTAGMLFLIAELIWLILVPAAFPIEQFFPPLPPGSSITFWSLNLMGMSIPLHNVGFGLIGGFIAAGIAFGGAGAAHYYSKEREVKVPEKKEIVYPTKEPTASETSFKEFPKKKSEVYDRR